LKRNDVKSENKLIGAGLLTAITASLCCITPVLALITGILVNGLSSNKPDLITGTIVFMLVI